MYIYIYLLRCQFKICSIFISHVLCGCVKHSKSHDGALAFALSAEGRTMMSPRFQLKLGLWMARLDI